MMPLAHSVPDARACAPPDAAHDPSVGLPATVCGDTPFPDGVCFYLGPLRRRYLGPGKIPVLGYLFAAAIEGPDWIAFPCDVGGWLRRPDADPVVDAGLVVRLSMPDHGWRAYLARVLGEGFPQDWSGYLSYAGPAPAPNALPTELRRSVSEDDPLTWTPEVRSPSPVRIDGTTVAAAFMAVPVVTAERERDDALSAAMDRLNTALKARGVAAQPVARIGAEGYDRALHRASEAWIRRAAG